MKNPCISTITTKRVVGGRIVSPQCSALCVVKPANTPCHEDGVELYIPRQEYSKSDLRHLILMLTEIHGALPDMKMKVTKTACNCVQCKDFEKDVR